MFENFPYTKQIHQKDCGSACLKMIAEYYGKNFNMEQLSNTSKVYYSGISMFQLVKEANKIGLQGQALKISLESIHEVNLPAILHWNKNHFVVLFKMDEDSYHVADPVYGISKLTQLELLSNWTTISKEGYHEGVILSFSPLITIRK